MRGRLDSGSTEHGEAVLTRTLEDIIDKAGLNGRVILYNVACVIAYATFSAGLISTAFKTASYWEVRPEMKGKQLYNLVYVLPNALLMCLTPLMGYVADKWGRQVILLSGSCLCLGGSLLCGLFAQNSFALFVVFETLIVLGTGCFTVVVVTMSIEVSPLKYKSLFPTISAASGATACALSALLATQDTFKRGKWYDQWRMVCWFEVLLACIAIAIQAFTFAECPRYYAKQGFTSGNMKALQQSVQYFCDIELEEDAAMSILQSTVKSLDNITTEPQPVQENTGKLSLLQIWKLERRKLTLLSIAWFCMSFGFWGVASYLPSFFKDADLNPKLSLPMTYVVQIPSIFGSLKLINSGRLRAYRLLCVGQVAVMGVTAVALGIDAVPLWFTAIFAFSVYVFAGPLWNVLYVFSPEILPLQIRGRCISLLSIVKRIPNLFSPFLGSWMLSKTRNAPYLYPIVFAIPYTIMLLIGFFGFRKSDKPV